MKYVLTVFVLLVARPAFAQQSTTDTTCNVYSQTVNCTSNTTSTGSTDAQRAEQQREMNEAGQAVGAAMGSLIGNAVLKHRVNKYCAANPAGGWRFANGNKITCWDWNSTYQPKANAQLRVQREEEMATIELAAWTFCTTHPDQSWTGPVSGKVTSCGQLIALHDATCSRNPGSAYCKATTTAPVTALTVAPAVAPVPTPVVVAATTPVPMSAAIAAPVLTPEQRDEISFCKRNPKATVTTPDDAVVPCKTVLATSR